MRGSGASGGHLLASEHDRDRSLAIACALHVGTGKLRQRHRAVRGGRHVWTLLGVECILLLVICQIPLFPAESSDVRLSTQICTTRNKVEGFFEVIKKARKDSAEYCENSPNFNNNSSPNSTKCSATCKANPGNLTINFTDFRFYAEFAIENAQLLSSLIAHLPLTDQGWPVGADSYANRSCDELKALNFFAGGNSLFIVRATNSALTKNIFAAGACLGNGEYIGSECFYQPRDTSINITAPPAPQNYAAYHNVVADSDVPVWFSKPGKWILNDDRSGPDAWLGGACRSLCPNNNSTLLMSMDHCEIPDDITCPVLTGYSDDLWVKPYFDCELGFIWMVTYAAPVAVFRNNSVRYLGMAAIDVVLENIPIDQCTASTDGYSSVFADTHMCDKETSVCAPYKHISGSQLVNGRYVCACNPGFYYPHNSKNSSEIDGLVLTNRFINLNETDCVNDVRSVLQYFRCTKCPNLCKNCTSSADDCRYQTDLTIMLPFHILNGAAVVFIIGLLVYVAVKRGESAIRSASWQFLVVILAGCLVAFAGLFVSTYPLDVTCALLDWTTEVGFALSYGSILLKSWRIEQIFSNKAMMKPRRKPHLKNQDLAVYLIVLVVLCCILLAGATAFNLLRAENGEVDVVGKNEPQYFKRCSQGSFIYVTLGFHLIILFSSCYLCFKLRRVLNSYAESHEISLIVYFSSLIEMISFIGKLLLETTPDVQYAVRSIELLFLFGAMPAVLFLPKVRKVEWPTLEEIALTKATTAQMRLLRSTSATAMRRRGTISLDSIHRDSILDWALQQGSPAPAGPPVLAVRYNRRRISTDHSSFFGSRTSSFMGSTDYIPAKAASNPDSQCSSSPTRKRRSHSLAGPTVHLALPDHLRRPGTASSSSRNFSIGSIGSIIEERLSTGSGVGSCGDLHPLSPMSAFSAGSTDVVMFPACTTAGLSGGGGSGVGLHDLERRHSTPAFLGDRSAAPKMRDLQIPAISITSRYSDVMEVDDETSPPPSAMLNVAETKCQENHAQSAARSGCQT